MPTVCELALASPTTALASQIGSLDQHSLGSQEHHRLGRWSNIAWGPQSICARGRRGSSRLGTLEIMGPPWCHCVRSLEHNRLRPPKHQCLGSLGAIAWDRSSNVGSPSHCLEFSDHPRLGYADRYRLHHLRLPLPLVNWCQVCQPPLSQLKKTPVRPLDQQRMGSLKHSQPASLEYYRLGPPEHLCLGSPALVDRGVAGASWDRRNIIA